MRNFFYFCRLMVGPLFIVSGLIKANDTLGFSYKLHEYFADTALNLPAFEPYALLLAGLACLAEVVLGFAIMFGGRLKLALWSLVILTIFFGWLTAYTATCDPFETYTVVENGVEVQKTKTCVTDCGCFGDAMKGSIGRSLTPWESFSKDAILFVFILPLFIGVLRGKKQGLDWNGPAADRVLLPLGLLLVAFFSWVFTWWFPVLFYMLVCAGYLLIKSKVKGSKAEWISAGFVALVTFAMMFYTYHHLPLRDYRPYADEKNLPEQMVIPEGEVPDRYENYLVYRNKNTGEEKDFTQTNYPWKDTSNWEWVSTKSVLVERGYNPPITDLALLDEEGFDVTEMVLSEETPVLWFIMYDIEIASTSNKEQISKLIEQSNDAGYKTYGLTSSSKEDWEKYRHEQGYAFSYLNGDGIVLKTIVRSNPGLVLLKQGTVKGKWSVGDMPTFDALNEALK